MIKGIKTFCFNIVCILGMILIFTGVVTLSMGQFYYGLILLIGAFICSVIFFISLGGESDEEEGQKVEGKKEIYDVNGYPVFETLRSFGVQVDNHLDSMELPDGWKEKPHYNGEISWFMVVDKDEKLMFSYYDGPFFEDVTLATRFDIVVDGNLAETEKIAVAQVFDRGDLIYTTDPIELPEKPSVEFQVSLRRAYNLAMEWLEETKNCPDWRDPMKYRDKACI
jgi:hypothetical protein